VFIYKQGHAAVSGAGRFGSWLAAISERNKHDFTNIDGFGYQGFSK
jgi:hypothetical protein